MIESFGQRVARLRTNQGWTQQELAERMALSRVAISHLEAGLTLPSERTVMLLAGLFKLEPPELIAGSSYPEAKAERLPSVTCRYTELEFQLALLQRDLHWLARLRAMPDHPAVAHDIRDTWMLKLEQLQQRASNGRDRELIAQARQRLLQADATGA